MDISEIRIKEYFIIKGYEVKSYSKDEMRRYKNKTPDFRVYKGDKLVFYCEVKKIEDFPIEKYNGTINISNDYTRMADRIYDSVKQFSNVNPDHTVPNILAIYSERLATDIRDFKYTFEGGRTTDTGEFYPYLMPLANGRIKNCKFLIDMCLWYDAINEEYRGLYYKESSFKDLLITLIDQYKE